MSGPQALNELDSFPFPFSLFPVPYSLFQFPSFPTAK